MKTSSRSSSAEEIVQEAHQAARCGEMERVIPLLREAVAQEPFHVEANSHLGWLLTQWGRYREALPAYFRLILRRPWDWQAHFRAAHTLWFACRRVWGRAASRISLLRRLSNANRRLLCWTAICWVRFFIPSAAQNVLPWMRNQLRVERFAPVNAYEYYKVAEAAFVLRALRQIPGKRVLDLGAGLSSFPSCLAQSGQTVVVVEREREALAIQHRLGQCLSVPIHASAGDFLALPFADGVFDYVTLISSVEHVPGDGDKRTIAEAARVLRPGGELIVTAPCGPYYAEHWTSHVIGHVYEEAKQRGKEGGFLRIYNEESIRRRLIDPSGLELMELLAWGESVIWGWLGLGRNFVDHRGVIHPSAWAAPLCLLFSRELAWGELALAHWSVALLRLKKPLSDEKSGANRAAFSSSS